MSSEESLMIKLRNCFICHVTSKVKVFCILCHHVEMGRYVDQIHHGHGTFFLYRYRECCRDYQAEQTQLEDNPAHHSPSDCSNVSILDWCLSRSMKASSANMMMPVIDMAKKMWWYSRNVISGTAARRSMAISRCQGKSRRQPGQGLRNQRKKTI